ncbi:1572_t:CDS:10 [Entrophospora sp. SA101]|nr:1572_t:CDS:10 [Entrophospora sp. SA101]
MDYSDNEQEYEKLPRVNKNWIIKESKKLPIKLPDGKLQHKILENNDEMIVGNVDELMKMDEEDKEENEKDDDEKEIMADDDQKEKVITKKEYIIQKKKELGQIAKKILEDPETNIGKLKKLRDIAMDDNIKIRKLALLTQLVVYKDIIPGYRIRQLTDKEKAVKVSKEVKKLRNYEQDLLSNYQKYLNLLEDYIKENSKNPTNNNDNDRNVKDQKSLVVTALRCVCELLTSVTHFNFRLNLMNIIIGRMSKKTFTKMTAICCDSIIELFKNDESGEASLDAVKLMTKMFKFKNYIVHEEILRSFLHLRLKEELNYKMNNNDDDGDDKIEIEMKEVEAVVDKKEKENRQTETLKLVFITYFRILKHANGSNLLLPVLEGLAKFSHLINIDFFNDLLEVLKKIMVDCIPEEENMAVTKNRKIKVVGNSGMERIDTRKCLLCIITTFQLLSGQEALNIDLQDFYKQFYTIILPLALNPNLDSKIRKSEMIPINRSASFLKRLSIASLNWSNETVLKCLNTIEKMIKRQICLETFLSSEDKITNGIYKPDLNDPELCNPFATSLWELSLLEI